ncbi:hypothetical protein C8J55DRAFT_558167 [Lentinula edodes]|uniref:Uncharacterized protein n=1 Tax=Lentinula lateritia TaxID=40482 RepID=A0A9W9ANE3_9AGAR|nr:hypothetical protein C8J55DRAFT_558167 [Lentinula edodes]
MADGDDNDGTDSITAKKSSTIAFPLNTTMEDSAIIPSLSMGPVGSRFVSSDEIETAKACRDEQWKAA